MRNKTMLQLENFEDKFEKVINSKEWKLLEGHFKKATHIFIFGNGGNLAIADHAAIDISRLTDKNAEAPGSGITATSIIGDKDAESWIKTWLEYKIRGIDTEKCLAIGLSCSTSGASSNALQKALSFASSQKMPCAIISAQPKENISGEVISISQNVELYHTSEILSLALTYQLTHSAGFECPSVFKKARTRKFEKLGISSETQQGNI
jgi:D-sedoheptulose 7-phosphate isomerase